MAAGLVLGAAAPAVAQADCRGAPGEVRLAVTVVGVRAATGVVTVTAYPDDPAKFLAPRGKVARLRVPAARPTTVACLAVPAPGAYALAVYHDEDGDRKFTRSAVGLPTEGYGFSNDASTVLGPPSFAAARFVAKAGDNPMTVTLKY